MPTVKIKGMSCGHCVSSVTQALSNIEGITDVRVDLEKAEATYKETQAISPETINEAITSIGFEVG